MCRRLLPTDLLSLSAYPSWPLLPGVSAGSISNDTCVLQYFALSTFNKLKVRISSKLRGKQSKVEKPNSKRVICAVVGNIQRLDSIVISGEEYFSLGWLLWFILFPSPAASAGRILSIIETYAREYTKLEAWLSFQEVMI
ncbi:uncharacterized protein MCYG_07509 [Microsporum canis CBS 113480]|uniref:Uncharacterized protein n=1 Tax=Arthroderma otae (strain ATCC MYA-4605 / CBS 113480) TaxID=554155 RepID=C5FYU2_ARTOC|nr:uncharacterized protein MCYG_07509 [Microsporum canis CBS 113480]EEQ34690.1 predicted protein [Microsporum canis CBS 113480]